MNGAKTQGELHVSILVVLDDWFGQVQTFVGNQAVTGFQSLVCWMIGSGAWYYEGTAAAV